MEKPALSASGLFKTYRRAGASPIRVLDGAEIEVAPGRSVAVLGRSGSGKSTLLNLLGGLDRPDPGRGARIEIAGTDICGAGEKTLSRIRAANIGFVFQSFRLLPELTVLENACFPAMAAGGVSRKEAAARAEKLLRAAGLGDRLDHRPDELSGGEQQRVAVARALANRPGLLLADEPTGNLDGATGMRVLDLVFDLSGAAGGVRPAVVMVTHSDAVAARCDRTLVLSSGKLSPTPENRCS
ncbi:MAG: ABC transporter ATP-binding protein [Kiritimatiellae bacterium]|nr:ABC transporter ATP-binding protein [Kiritimatiellia bacterium]